MIVVAAIVAAVALVARIAAVAPVSGNSSFASQLGDLSGFLPAFGFFFEALTFAGAVLVTLPLQATALRLRCNRADGLVFAAVTGLSLVSSIVSVAVLFAMSPLLALVGSPDLYGFGVIGFYVFHTITLALARSSVTTRQRRRDGAGVV